MRAPGRADKGARARGGHGEGSTAGRGGALSPRKPPTMCVLGRGAGGEIGRRAPLAESRPPGGVSLWGFATTADTRAQTSHANMGGKDQGHPQFGPWFLSPIFQWEPASADSTPGVILIVSESTEAAQLLGGSFVWGNGIGNEQPPIQGSPAPRTLVAK